MPGLYRTISAFMTGLILLLIFANISVAEDVVLDFTFSTQEVFTDSNQPYEGGDRGVTIRSYSDPLSFDTFDLETCTEPDGLKNGFAGEFGCSDADDLRFYLNGYTSDRISVNVGISESISGDNITATLKGYANIGGNLVEIPGLAPASIYLGSGVQDIDDNVLILEDSEGRIGGFTISYGYNCEVEKIDCVSIHVWEEGDPPPPVDPDPPVITITTPENDAAYGRSRIMVSGTVEETVGLTLLAVEDHTDEYNIDITSQRPPEYRFAQMVNLTEGVNDIWVHAIDIGGHDIWERRTITFTPYPPPPPDPPPNLDIEATGMEVTQGIQGWEMIHYTDYVDRDTARLISGKKTLVRVYGEAKGTSIDIEGVTCKLEGFIGGPAGTPLPGSPLYSFDPVTLAAGENYIQQREDKTKSFNFILPDTWTQPGTTTLVATVNNGQPIMERPGRYDSLNSHFKDVRFNDTQEFCIFMYRIYESGEPNPSLSDSYENLSLLEQIYPVAPDKLNIIDAGLFRQSAGHDLNNMENLIDLLREFRRSCGFWWGRARVAACANESYLGLTHDTNRHRGVTHSEFPVSLSVASTDADTGINFYYKIKSSHEVGHAQTLGHVDSYSADCSATDDDDNHEPKEPYEDYHVQRDPSGVYYDAASIGQWGVDIRPDNTFNLKSPWDTGDMMSYCGRRWMSIHTWNRLADQFGASVPETASLEAMPQESYEPDDIPVPKADVPHLIIDGIITPDDTGKLYPAWQDKFKDGAYDYEGKGDYTITLLDKEANVLFIRHFDKKPVYDNERFSSFSQIIPLKKGVDQFCLSGPQGFKTLCRTAGNAIPSVTLLFPNGNETFPAKGTTQVYWTAEDDDGDTLTYSVFYSNNNGITWQVAADEIPGMGINMELDHLPGAKKSCLIKVLATDGIHQGEDTSDAPFTKGNVSPTARIISPIPVAVFKRKMPVTLKAFGSDMEDRHLAAENMNWYSDRNGFLGTGNILETQTLRSGMHEITFKAFDLDGNSARDTTRIYIEPTPYADIKDAADDGPRTILPSDPIKIRCEIDAAEDIINGDYWLFVRTPLNNTYYWYKGSWINQEVPYDQGAIEDQGPLTMLEPRGEDLPDGVNGSYVFFFGVDTIQDGYVNWSDFYYDTITISVDPCQSDLDTDDDVDGKDIYLFIQNFIHKCLGSFAGTFGKVQ